MFSSLPQSIQTADFEGCGLGDNAASAVGRFILRSSIRELLLGENRFTGAGLREIAEAVAQSLSIKRLEIQNKDGILGEEDAKVVADRLVRRNKSLRRLRVGNRSMDAACVRVISKAILDTFKGVKYDEDDLRRIEILSAKCMKEECDAVKTAVDSAADVRFWQY